MPLPAHSVFFCNFIILLIKNWSFATLYFLWHSFCSSGNNVSFCRWKKSSLLNIPLNTFYLKGRHVISQKLVTSFSFLSLSSLSFIISAVLPLVNQSGVPLISKNNCYYTAILSRQNVKSFIKDLCAAEFSNFQC